MSQDKHPTDLIHLTSKLWGDTPPGRWLSRQTLWFLIASVSYLTFRLALGSLLLSWSSEGALWHSALAFTIDGAYAVCLIWFGFQLSIGFQARLDAISPWGNFMLLACCGLAAALANQALARYTYMTTGTSLGILLLGFKVLQICIVLCMVVKAVLLTAAAAAKKKIVRESGPRPIAPPSPQKPISALRVQEPPTVAPAITMEPPAIAKPLPNVTREERGPATATAVKQTIFCRHCGNEFISGAKFCRNCGAARVAG